MKFPQKTFPTRKIRFCLPNSDNPRIINITSYSSLCDYYIRKMHRCQPPIFSICIQLCQRSQW
ncbi:hypothetical protein AR1Y2_1322 [Anaerostipes rhamnosivorans]|uniref:Uncharacterized protein n=1 Tax=Anaerostipes rhamnosivorans TaxID=1229621 RepID=A0A4P8IBE7_9FIRM|nr:hypothetical protein AR1Y2_1322 [Anaerostipes rhamnosivorans]